MHLGEFQKHFLETPDKSCIQFQDRNGKLVRIVKFRTQENFEWLYFSHALASETDNAAMYCLGYLVNSRDLYIYESHVQEFRVFFDGESDKIETIHDAFLRTQKMIFHQILKLSEGVELPALNEWMQEEALEQAYTTYVQGIELEPDIRFHGFSEASVLIHSLFNGYGGTIAFANEYFDQKHEYCLIWLAVYRQAESLIKTWERDPDCAASLSKDMYQAAINNNVLNHMLVRMGEHEYSTTLSNFKNIFFVGSDNSMLPVKDNEKKTVVIAKSSITELATKGGKVFWERHKDKNG